MKASALLPCTLLALSLVPNPIRAADMTALIALQSSVLKLEARRAQGGYALGSAVVVAENTVVTACHVTRDAQSISVLRGGVRWVAEGQLSDLERDLCMLRVPGLRGTVVTLGRAEQLERGQTLKALGYSLGAGLQYSEGVVVALHDHDGSTVVQSTNYFNSGASGGGLFDDELRLVGILTFRSRGSAPHYFSSPAEWVATMLAAPAQAYAAVAPNPSPQSAYWQRPAAEQPDFLKKPP